MADNRKVTSQELRDLSLQQQELFDILADQKAFIDDAANKYARGVREKAEGLKINITSAKQLAKVISGLQQEDMQYKRASAKLSKEIVNAEADRKRLLNKIEITKGKAAVSSKAEQRYLNQIVQAQQAAADHIGTSVDESKKLLQTLKQIDSDVSFFDDMADIVSDIPVLRKLFKDFDAAAKAARDADSKGKGFLDGLLKLGGVGAKAGLAFAFSTFVSGIKKGQITITEFSRNLNITRDQAQALNNTIRDSAGNYILFEELEKAIHGVANELGIVFDATSNMDTVKTISVMTSRLGLSVEQASKLATYSASTNQELSDFSNKLVGNVKIQNALTKSAVRYQDVLKDVAESSAATQITTAKYEGGIGRAVYEARRLGIEFKQLETSANALLNFESSIQSELEAELLTGRHINLEQARLAALKGDQATLANELAKNLGSSAEFGRLNVIAQEAYAKSLGMSRDEVAKMLQKQEAMQKFGMDLRKDVKSQILDEYKRVSLLTNAEEKAKAMAELQKKAGVLGEEELLRQEKNQSNQEAMAKAMDDLARVASTIAKPFDMISNFFTSISSTASAVLKTITAISAVLFLISKRSMGKGLLNLFKGGGATGKAAGLSTKQIAAGFGGKAAKDALLGGGVQTAAKGGGMISKLFGKSGTKVAGKAGLKAGGKSLLKKIPLIGALAGAGFAIQRAREGDWTGAAMEAASGVASTFPGIGTGVSAALDVGLAGRDIYKAQDRGSEPLNGEANVNDFTIRANPKDTLVMAGGTKFGEETNALLRELIAAVTSGGDIYMDGNKVGQTLRLATVKSS